MSMANPSSLTTNLKNITNNTSGKTLSKEGASAIAGASGGITGLMNGIIQGTLVNTLNDLKLQISGLANKSYSYGLGNNSLLNSFANTNFARESYNWRDFMPDNYGTKAASNVVSSTVGGAATGTSIMPGWGTLIGAGVGLLGGGLGSLIGYGIAKAKAKRLAPEMEAAARLANVAAVNHFGEAADSLETTNNFLLRKELSAEGGPIYKKGTILDVDEEALDLLKELGYKYKILN